MRPADLHFSAVTKQLFDFLSISHGTVHVPKPLDSVQQEKEDDLRQVKFSLRSHVGVSNSALTTLHSSIYATMT